MTIPNGSSHSIGHQQRRGAPQQLVLGRIIHRPDVYVTRSAVDVGLDLRVEVRLMAVRHVAGDHQPPARSPGDLDRDVRTLEVLDAPQEHEGRVGRHGGLEAIARGIHGVGNDAPGREVTHALEHAIAARRERDPAKTEPPPPRHTARRDGALIRHDLRRAHRPHARQRSEAAEAVDDVGPCTIRRARDHGRDGRNRHPAAVCATIRHESGRCDGTPVRDERHVVAARHETIHQQCDHALDAAVQPGWNRQFRVRRHENAKGCHVEAAATGESRSHRLNLADCGI